MSGLLIDIYCNDGSPIGVVPLDIYGRGSRIGVGGAELALFTMIHHWVVSGHRVRLYNDPQSDFANESLNFRQFFRRQFNPTESRDILITFRSPASVVIGAKGKKIWWSTDQYTVGDFSEFSKTQDRIVVISPYHANYFRSNYGISETVVIDLPVRSWDYGSRFLRRKNHRALFSSVPNRGLPILAKVWERILEKVPDAELVITSGWTLWDNQPDNQRLLPYRMLFLGKNNVTYRGAIRRNELIEEQLTAGVLAYPCIYPELFCYAVAEAQVAGAIPVTSTVGALATTSGEFGIAGDPNSDDWQALFVDKVVERMLNGDDIRQDMIQKARDKFSIERIGKEWENVFFF